MLLFKDIVTNAEILSDSFKIVEKEDGAFYEVVAKKINVAGGVDPSLLGANASQEVGGDDEGAEDTVVTPWDIVHNHTLQKQPLYSSKKDYQLVLKAYMKKVLVHLEENKPDRVDAFKKSAAKYIKEVVLANFKEMDFYKGDTDDTDGMVILCRWIDGEENPTFIFFADGMYEEKV